MKKLSCLFALLMLSMLIFGCAVSEDDLISGLSDRCTLHSGYDTERPLTEQQISLLLSAGFSMPTGGSQQSLHFYVVQDRETMRAMRGGNPYSQALESAPCVIVIAGDMRKALYPELQEMDAGLAAGAILAQASETGLSTCVLSISPQAERIESVMNALSMEPSLMPILMIAAGYPADDAYSSASVDGWDDSRVHWARK